MPTEKVLLPFGDQLYDSTLSLYPDINADDSLSEGHKMGKDPYRTLSNYENFDATADKRIHALISVKDANR